MYTYDQAYRVWRVAFNGGVVDQIMIYSYNCSDLLLSIVTESVSLDHRLVLRRLARICERKCEFHPAYHKPRTCQNFFFQEINYNRGTNAETDD